MSQQPKKGDTVKTQFGKGVVREVRTNGRLLVDVYAGSLVVSDSDVSKLDDQRSSAVSRQSGTKRRLRTTPSRSRAPVASAEVDLHRLTVEEALARAEHALNEALLADIDVLRLIHGRSGGHIRAALHSWLRENRNVSRFVLDPKNDGVTIVDL